jgi:ferredoxin-NADP reductase
MTISENKKEKNKLFILKEKIRESDDVLTLKFLPQEGEKSSFKAGQFVMVYFPDKRAGNITRAYSISSCPKDDFLSFTVKKVGVFSSALHDLKVGEKVEVGPALGDFYPTESMDDLVFLAGGIGVAPFYSIIRNFHLGGVPKKISLFYSSRTKKDIVFFKELNEIAASRPSFKVFYFLTREQRDEKIICACCRINADILKERLKDLKRKNYFICGPGDFVNNLSSILKENGVEENFIRKEAFF